MIKPFKEMNKTKIIIILALLFIVLAAFLHIARHIQNETLIDSESYNNIKAAKEIEKNGLNLDNLNLTQIILSILSNKKLSSIIISLIFTLSSCILFYLILSLFNIPEKIKFFSSVLLLLSPPFIYLYASYTNYTLLIFFILLFSYLYLKNKNILSFFAIVPIIFISLPTILLIIPLILILNIIKIEKNTKEKYYLISFISISTIITFIINPSIFTINKLFFTERSLFISSISDFGAIIGFGIFEIILAMIGVVILWPKTKKHLTIYLSLILSLILSLFIPLILILLNFIICYFAAIALFEIYHKSWEILTLKNITIIIIIYGILFSCFSYETRLINSNPTKTEVSALASLKEMPDGIVFSHYKNGYTIEYFAEKKVFTNNKIFFIKDGTQKLNYSNNLFQSRSLEKTTKLLKDNNIKYIYIDSEMKDGLVFSKRNEGLLFLLDKSTSFKKIYDNDGIEIWQVIE